MTERTKTSLDENFVNFLAPLVDHCVSIVKKRGKAHTKAAKRLKSYVASVKVLREELASADSDHVKIKSNIKSFRQLLSQLNSTIDIIRGGDSDDSWLWLKHAPRRIIYMKNGIEIKKISLHLSEIYQFCRNVNERYQFILLLFAVLRSVAEKSQREPLSVIIDLYTTKIRSIPEEEEMIESESASDDRSEDGQKGAVKAAKGVLGSLGITPKLISKVANGEWDDGEAEDGSGEANSDDGASEEEKIEKKPRSSKDKQ